MARLDAGSEQIEDEHNHSRDISKFQSAKPPRKSHQPVSSWSFSLGISLEFGDLAFGIFQGDNLTLRASRH
jgi:hypothetical protein